MVTDYSFAKIKISGLTYDDCCSHDELQLVRKQWDASSGKALDDSVQSYSLEQVASEIQSCKDRASEAQSEQADWEELEKDLKAL